MRSHLIVAVLIFASGACAKNNEPPPPSTGSPNPRTESGPSKPAGKAQQAEMMFGTVCATCHGADGSGKGPGAQALTIKPRDYTDPAWQASVTDDQIKEIILKGGAAVGKSPAMPPSPHLADQPEVLDGLVKMIRGFGKKP